MPIIWLGRSLREPAGSQVDMPWGEFAARARNPKPGLAKDDLARWAPVEFARAYRCRANVVRVHAVVLDIDDGSPLPDLGCATISHSTFSAAPDAPRWRAIYPLSRPVDADEYERVWRWLAIEAEDQGITPDYAARDAPHCWAVPAVPPSGFYAVDIRPGRRVPVDDALQAIPQPEPPPALISRDDSYDRRAARARMYLARMDPSISGSGGHAALFRAAVALVRGFALEPDDALAMLVTEFNPLCQPEWSLSDLRHKVRSALQRSKMPFGALATKRR